MANSALQTIVKVEQQVIVSVLRKAFANCVELKNLALNSPDGTDESIDLHETVNNARELRNSR